MLSLIKNMYPPLLLFVGFSVSDTWLWPYVGGRKESCPGCLWKQRRWWKVLYHEEILLAHDKFWGTYVNGNGNTWTCKLKVLQKNYEKTWKKRTKKSKLKNNNLWGSQYIHWKKLLRRPLQRLVREFSLDKNFCVKKKSNNKKSIPRGLKFSVRLSLYNVCWCVFHIIAYHVKIIID